MLRPLLILGGVFFGAFAVVAFTFQRLDISQETLSIVGGALAYGFLASVVALWVVHRRRRRGLSDRILVEYLAEHPRVQQTVGRPVEVGSPDGDVHLEAKGGGTATLRVPVAGPIADATADLVVAKLDAHWEVLGGELEVDGERVPLTGVSGVG
jgi:hypothetical protein